MEKFKFHLENNQNEVIVSNLDECCSDCLINDTKTCKKNNEMNEFIRKYRIDKIISKKGISFLCSFDIKTTKLFKQMSEFINYSIPWFETIRNEITPHINKEEKKQTRRLLHNIRGLNGKNIQEIYAFVPQDILIHGYKNQTSIVQELIQKHPGDAAKLFIRILKNNSAIKTEISVFDNLYNDNITLNFDTHSIKSVILLVYHTFAQDFRDKNVNLNIQELDTKINIDFESFRVAIYHIVENALKYTKPNSTIDISFNINKIYFEIFIIMVSVRIEINEIDKLFDESYTGINTKKLNKTGTGIGMYLVKTLLNLNKAEIEIIPNYEINNVFFDGINYCQNIFHIKIKK